MLRDLKGYLKVTWHDEDALLQSFLDQGQAYLDGLVGAKLDYSKPGLARSLLFDYCRYVYNNASEYFEENFRAAIVRLQLQVAVRRQ